MDFGGSFLYRLLKDLLKWIKGRKGNLSPADRLAARQKWKPVFEETIAARRRDGLRSDVVVRDVKRLDQYPNTQESERGISAWFKVGLVGTYHKGVMVQLNWIGIVSGEKRLASQGAERSEKFRFNCGPYWVCPIRKHRFSRLGRR